MLDDERAWVCPTVPKMRCRVPPIQLAYVINYGVQDVKHLWEFSEARVVYVDSII